MEPFILVRGRLQKDGASMNVIASRVQALRVTDPRAEADIHPALPETLEYWGADRRGAGAEASGRPASETETKPDPGASFKYLTALRASPPGVKNFG